LFVGGSSGTLQSGPIAGITIGVLVLIAIVVIAILIYRRGRLLELQE
jgi:hypothetical protein